MRLDAVRIDAALELAGSFLIDSMVSNDGRSGFSESLKSQEFSPWATADGLMGICLSGADAGPRVQHCADSLYAAQLESGGWANAGEECSEATSHAVLALLFSEVVDEVRLASAAENLVRRFRNGSCSSDGAGSGRVFCTAMGVWALKECESRSLFVAPDRFWVECRDWFIDAQQEDGGWGFSSENGSGANPASTGQAIFALSLIDPTSNQSVAAGAAWIISNRPTTMTYSHEVRWSADGKPIRTTHLYLPWSALGLIAGGVSPRDPTLLETIEAILESQIREENRSHGAFAFRNDESEMNSTVWSTFRSIHALSVVREHLMTGSSSGAILTFVELYHRVEELEAAQRRMRVAFNLSGVALVIAVCALMWTTFPTELASLSTNLWESQGGRFWPLAIAVGAVVTFIVTSVTRSIRGRNSDEDS